MINWQLVDVVEVFNQVLFRNGQNTYFVYPGILLFGCVMSITIPQELFRNLKTLYLLNDNNIVNKVFANNGDLLFIILFVMIVFNKLLEFTLVNKVPDDLECQIQEETKGKKILKTMRGYLLRFTVLQGSMFALLAFRAWVLRKTGSDDEEGFRISGHFIFLTTVGISTVLEFGHSLGDSILLQKIKMEHISVKLSLMFYFYTFTMILSLISIIIWMICLLVTAVFYHTLLEKIIGLILGMIPPSITYLWLSKRFDFMK